MVFDLAIPLLIWRISVVSALTDMDYGNLVETLRRKFDPVIAKLKHPADLYRCDPADLQGEHELLNDLVESFFMAFVVIALVLMIALQVRAGLLGWYQT